MSSQPVAYALGGTLTEQQRLIAQAKGLEVHAKWLLDQIGVGSGQRTVDVGCGPIGILNLLPARVGRHGVVIGVEREQRFFDMAQAEWDTRRLQNAKLVRADALNTGLERNSYDFVHERLLLINFPPASQHALMVASIKDKYPDRAIIYSFLLGIVVLGVGFIFSFLVNDDRFIPRRILLKFFATAPPPRPRKAAEVSG